MKIQLCEHHGFKMSYVEQYMTMLGTEMSPEDILRYMVKHEMMPITIEDDVIFVMHPQNF